MSPTKDTLVYLMLSRIAAHTARMHVSIGDWDSAAYYATRAGDYMKKVEWELVK